MFYKKCHVSIEEEDEKENKDKKDDSKSTTSATKVLDHDRL